MRQSPELLTNNWFILTKPQRFLYCEQVYVCFQGLQYARAYVHSCLLCVYVSKARVCVLGKCFLETDVTHLHCCQAFLKAPQTDRRTDGEREREIQSGSKNV